MGRPHEAAKLLMEGLSPSLIAKELGISTGSVKLYLMTAVGEGLIRRSDILYGINRKVRDDIDLAIRKTKKSDSSSIRIALYKLGIECDRVEVELYLAFRDKKIFLGDIYEFIVSIESTLHRNLKQILSQIFGMNESGWWRKGIPEKVRISCSESRERDQSFFGDAYNYTTFIQLWEIIDHNWALISTRLPPVLSTDKKKLREKFTRLNIIRNKVMHPTRLEAITEEDFEFARTICSEVCRGWPAT